MYTAPKNSERIGWASVSGLLLDIEGVLLDGGAPMQGSQETMSFLAERGLPFILLTNTTTSPRREIAARLSDAGLQADENRIISPASAAARLLHTRGLNRIYLAAAPSLVEEFEEFQVADTDVDAVVIGDLHTGFTWARLDQLFQMLMDGVQLVALHKNRYCKRGAHLGLDLGPFVAALEYASRRSATIVGKPAQSFFEDGVARLRLPPANIAMVGDDLEADIGGALGAGMHAVQVRTGKYRAGDEAATDCQPTARLDSIADLPAWLDARC